MSFTPPPLVYSTSERNGVAVISTAGLISITAILCLITTMRLRKPSNGTHVVTYHISLFAANVLQSLGTVMNLKWVAGGAVVSGNFCSAQGGIKQAGNVGTAIWSFLIAVHVFNILFLRFPSTKIGHIATLSFGWAMVGFIVMVGPAAIQTPERGPYFGMSGLWCWITEEYPTQRTFLEYFIEFVSAGFGFILYSAVLLRVRGNLVSIDGKWRLRFVPRGESWKLIFSRDTLDNSMVRVALNMVWYPVAYSLVLVPIALARMIEFSGHEVPSWATIFTDVIFNLTGFVNVMLLLGIRRLLPDTSHLPEFTTPRKGIDSKSPEANGISPFMAPTPVMVIQSPHIRPLRRTYSLQSQDTQRLLRSSLSSSTSGSETVASETEYKYKNHMAPPGL